MSFVLIRHAKSTHNIKNIFAGDKINSRITKDGMYETKVLASKLLSKYRFDLIICSGLTRSLQTAKIIISKQNIKIIRTPLLNEVDVGVLTGTRPYEALTDFPVEYKNVQSKFISDWNFAGGESTDDLEERYKGLLDFLKPYRTLNVLIVGHAMFNQVIIKKVMGIEGYCFGHDSIVELKGLENKL